MLVYKIERETNDSISIKGGTNWCKTGSKLIQTAEQIKSDIIFFNKIFLKPSFMKRYHGPSQSISMMYEVKCWMYQTRINDSSGD